MSLKHNPFDQTPKGNLVRRRRVFSDPGIDESSKGESGINGRKEFPSSKKTNPSSTLSGNSLEKNISEQSSKTMNSDKIKEQSSKTLNNNKVLDQSLDNGFGTKTNPEKLSKNYVLGHSSRTLNRNLVPKHSSESSINNSVSEPYPETLFQNNSQVPEQCSDIEYRNFPPVSEQVSQPHSETKSQNSNTVLEHSNSSQTDPLPGHLDFSNDRIVDLTETLREPTKNYSKLIGLKKRIVTFVYDECIKHKASSIKTTYDQLARASLGEKESVRTTLKRLTKEPNSYMSLNTLGRGPGSQIIIRTKEDDLKNYMSFKLSSSETLLSNKVLEHSIGSRISSATNPSSSSSYNLINTNTTEATKNTEVKPASQDLPLEWAEIHTPDNVKEIGFGQTQVQQLYRLGKITASDVQSSLDAFSYDLETGGVRSKGSKLGLLMGVLRNSGAYISEGMIAEIKAQVESNEKRRRELEELDKRQAQEQLAEKAQKILGQMSPSEKLELIPVSHLFKEGSPVHERLLIAKIIEGLSENQ